MKMQVRMQEWVQHVQNSDTQPVMFVGNAVPVLNYYDTNPICKLISR